MTKYLHIVDSAYVRSGEKARYESSCLGFLCGCKCLIKKPLSSVLSFFYTRVQYCVHNIALEVLVK